MPLRLKALELHGYKTFASKTTFEFSKGITAIVGPNGSGKSNIADALRWVLGEQSYRLLRARKTEDMIFSGSQQRPRAGMASATILFDNTERWLPVDFSEVAVSRRAYRDGRNEYLLNGQHVRLREINELLAQSGLGERTYTILGQGLVDASLALKADERRKLFEEAAGIGMYRARREDAIRRLENTTRNLERVMDIQAELAPRLRRLERQAARAREYAQLQADLRLLLRDWYGYHWKKAQTELRRSQDFLRAQEEKLNEARRAYREAQESFAAFRARIQELRAALTEEHRRSSELHRQREETMRTLAVLEERQRSHRSALQAMQSELAKAEDEASLARERLEEAKSEAARRKTEYAEAEKEASAAKTALAERERARQKAAAALDAARREADALRAKEARLHARLDEFAARKESLRAALEEAEAAALRAEKDAADAEKALRAARARREKAESAFHAAQDALAAQKKTLEELEERQRKQAEKLSSRLARKSRLQAQLDVLDAAEEALAGYAEGAKFLLEAARASRVRASHGALSAALDIPEEYESAIAAALGEYVDTILLESEEDLEKALLLLEKENAGRAAILPLRAAAPKARADAPKDDAILGRASEFVRAPDSLRPAVELLLGATFLVRDRAAARRLAKKLPAAARLVTLRGEVFRPDGAVLAGGKVPSGALSRTRQRRELRQMLESLEKEIAAAEAEKESAARKAESARREIVSLEERLRAARADFDSARREEENALLSAESARRQQAWQAERRASLETDFAEAEDAERAALKEKADLTESGQKSKERIRTLESELNALELSEMRNQVSYWETRLAVSRQALETAQNRLEERRRAVDSLGAQRESLKARIAAESAALDALKEERAALQMRAKELNEALEALEARLSPLEAELREAEARDAEQQETDAAARRALSLAERRHGQAQLDATRKQETLDSLRQRIEDDFGLVMFSYREDVSGPVPLPFEGMVEQLSDIQELPPDMEEQVKQQRARLRRMGAVNPQAQEEYEKEKERYEFLQSQMADLKKADADLREIIAELDELTERAFYKTFKAVAQEFREIFVRLFGGGAARLTLTDPENLIETGIEIEARLPGRREQGLALLSGGERSLTAIALVFALLRVSPTPLCVMDEVDAMLDEANVARFREMLLELSQDTQFVVITHNRNTVQAAEVIYGVTMGRDSASQVISLKLDEISEEMLRGE